MKLWPPGYLPAASVAHFIKSDGVPFRDLVDARVDIRDDQSHELQRELAGDYSFWMRLVLDNFFHQCEGDAVKGRLLKKLSQRDRLPREEDVKSLFSLHDDDAQSQVATSSTSPSTSGKFSFCPYARSQEYAMRFASSVASPDALVCLGGSLPSLRNLLHADFDSMSALKGYSMLSGDSMPYTREFVVALATHLRTKVEQQLGNPRRPILCLFGNGRLAAMLNSAGLLPEGVIAVAATLENASTRYHARKRAAALKQRREQLGNIVAPSFHDDFPSDSVKSIVDALIKYEPAIVVVEQYTDRDWLSDIRGYFTVRHVLMLGQVDSPQFGSFSFPFLTFGIGPGPDTYWLYSDTLQKSKRQTQQAAQFPVDPPFVAQGYERSFLDEISDKIIHANDWKEEELDVETKMDGDGGAMGTKSKGVNLLHQGRCLAFDRTVLPKTISAATGSDKP